MELFQSISGESHNKEIETFFTVLKNFNGSNSIDVDLRERIERLMDYKKNFDKNSFLVTKEDQNAM